MLIKSADNKKTRLRLLKELTNSDLLDERQKNWLRDEYRRLAPGIAGERDAAHYLDMSFSESRNHAVLHDLRLEADGQTAQIDHLVVDRTLIFFLLETKTYSGSLHINEQGEFMAEYPGEKRYGIPSPLEQSRRHETVLRKVLKRLGITGRAGTSPRFVHVVMVHPKAIIHRPPADKVDTSMVIKADQFATWHNRYVDEMGLVPTLVDVVNVRTRNTVMEWGEKIKGEHQPTNPLELPPFITPRKPTTPSAPPVRVTDTPKEELVTTEVASPPKPPPAFAQSRGKPVCATCGKGLTPSAARHCKENAALYGGKLYCIDHQAAAKKA